MKILIQSCVFSPSVGGTETATRLLAIGLQELGHEVRVVTDTEGDSIYTASLDVYRHPSKGELLGLVCWCDVFIQSNISLRNAWPLLLCRRPWIIVHHSRIEPADNRCTLTSRLKQWVTRFATNLAVSRFMANNLHSPSVVLQNPYADDVFRVQSGVTREQDLIVVGRFLEDKGFQAAIEALYRLHQRGLTQTRMTIVGEGPYREQLVALIQKRHLQGAIDLMSIKPPEDLAHLFNHHKILIVPSLTSETFGLVAVEGMACGCLVVGSDVGSLKETIGPCGLTFKAGDVDALTDLLQSQLEHPEAKKPYVQAAADHLSQFVRARIIPAYADAIEQAVADWKK